MKHQELTQEWDKTFPKSDRVNHKKVVFHNRFGIELVADMYIPRGEREEMRGEREAMRGEKFAAIAVCGPFGAVKEQASGLYAQEMAERGFLTIAFDPSYTGESGGEPRRVASPDVNTEDFSAAVDFLSTQPDVAPDRIGIIGICGWGGLALNTAAIDPRIRATVASTMYDLSRVSAKGYFDADDSKEKRQAARRALVEQRTKDYAAGIYERAGGVIDPLPDDAPQFVKDYFAYYKTPRGYHVRSGNSNDGWNKTGTISYLSTALLRYVDEIEAPVLIIHGEKAHSRYMSETAFEQMTGTKPDGFNVTVGNKELLIVPGATHCDLYDQHQYIPFDRLEAFFAEHLQ